MENDPCFHLKNSHEGHRLSQMVLELSKGHQKMSTLGPAVGVFGSSRLTEDSPYYSIAKDLGKRLSKKGYAVVTGGGPGIMEAANLGAQEGPGRSCGISVDLNHEEPTGRGIDPNWHLHLRYFFTRKILFVRHVQAFIFLPGGYGSLDELFEILTLMQTERVKSAPIFLVGSSFWKGLISWIRDELLSSKMIGSSDLDLIQVEDDLEAVIRGIDSR